MLESFQWALLICLAIAVTGGLVGLVKLWIELKAMQKSTHTMTYIDPLQAAAFSNKPDAEQQAKMNDDNMGNIAL